MGRHRRVAWIVVVACLAWPGAASAKVRDVPVLPAVPASALASVKQLAILHNGRVKPFDSFARETVRLITGAARVQGQDPAATLLAIAADPSAWTDAKILALPYGPLREALGVDRRATHVSYNELVDTKALMRRLPALMEKQQRDEPLTVLDHETMDAYDRFVAFSGVLQQRFAMAPGTADAREWTLILESPAKDSWEALVDAFKEGQADRIRSAAEQVQAAAGVNPRAYPPAWQFRLEIAYNRAAPFAAARALYVLAAVLLLLGLARPGGRTQAGLAMYAAAAVAHVAGIAARVVIGGRPPVSNFYETMLWLPLVAVVLAGVFERIYRGGVFALAAAIVAGVTLLIAEYVPLDSSISPVVAVLRSNLWLTIHVLTIVASYGALALATVLAHLYAARYLMRAPASAMQQLDTYLYRAIQVGVVLLAGGIMLGAVWANASWGRYWGWDPKETWALITLLWFLAALHGRFAGWLRGVGVALCTIAGFLLLLMTYYGVSFYLVGLHSYAGGHAKPVPPLLLAYLAAEAAFLVVVGLAALRRPQSSRPPR